MNDLGTIAILVEADIVTVRRTIRDAAGRLGFSLTDVTRIITAAAELSRNIYLYAGEGRMHYRLLDREGRQGIELCAEDAGPGIGNIEKAMTPGYSSAKGLGLGLPGTRRLMDEMEIISEVGKGTRITVRKWISRR